MKGKLDYEKIVKRRLELDWKQLELARESDVSVDIIRSIESGRSNSTSEALNKICLALGLDINDIYYPDFKFTKVISVINNKGGVGKTSVCGGIGCTLAQLGYKVLFIDSDMQYNLTYSLGLINFNDVLKNMRLTDGMHLGNAILKEENLINYIQNTQYENVDAIMADPEMASLDMEMFAMRNRESILKLILRPIIDKGIYDFIIFDTNAMLGLLNYNVLNVTDYVVVPFDMEIFSILGLNILFNFINDVKKSNDKLQVAGIFANRFDPREKQIIEACQPIANQLYGDKLLKTRIGLDTKLKQAQYLSVPVIYSQSETRIVKQYKELTKELLEIVK